MDQLRALCEELEEAGRQNNWKNENKPDFCYLDLAELQTDALARKQLEAVRKLAREDGRIDVLVNNAGLAHRYT